MTSLVQKEIVAELKDSEKDFENVILGTYTLDTQFFEEAILRILQQKDARRIVVMTDSKSYKETFRTARNAGVTYLIEPIKAAREFHPKFILMTSKEAGRIFIGSANLTENGFLRDGELFTHIDSDFSKEYPEVLSLFVDMKDFLLSLSEKGLIRSKRHREQIVKALGVPWLVDKKPTDRNRRRIRLLNSVERPILSQINEILEKEKIRKIILCAPFFDLNGAVLDYLAKNLCSTIQLYVQSDRVRNLPVNAIRKLIARGRRISTFTIAFRNDVNRYMHAKIIQFETNKGSYCLTGSANATSAGLLSNSRTGNVELCLLRFEEKKGSFDNLLFNRDMAIEQIDPLSLKANPLDFPSEGPGSDIHIEEAKLESGKLILDFSPPLGRRYRNATVTISRPVPVKPIVIKQVLMEKNRIIIDLTEGMKKYCEESSFVTIKLRRDSKFLISDKRWISTEVFEQIPKRRDINIIEKTNGRIGLIKLMNQLDRASELPAMLLYYLQHLDFDWLAESLDKTRRRIFKKYIGEELDEERAFSDRELPSAEEILGKIIHRHTKKFEQMIQDVKPSENLEIRVQKMFDLFLFLCKITIWFKLRKLTGTRALIDTVKRMQMLVGTKTKYWYRYDGYGYFDRIIESIGRERFLRIHEKLYAPLHFMVLSKIIIDLTDSLSARERRRLRGQLERIVANSFMRDNKKLVSWLSKDKLKKVIQEYDEYEYFSLSYKRLRKQALEIIKHPKRYGHCSECKKETPYRIASDTFLCLDCARRQFGKKRAQLALMQCHKCGYCKWLPVDRISGMQFCEKDGMRMLFIPAEFHIPRKQ